VWFPMGRRNERVLRIAAKEAVLLNSRDKVWTSPSQCL
jgi:hypothetical protein